MPDSATIVERTARAEGGRIVQFRSDGLGLSPAAYARLLAEIAETRGIAPDDTARSPRFSIASSPRSTRLPETPSR